MQSITTHSTLMRRALEHGNVLDGLKHAANMLKELIAPEVTPKEYYQLYMLCFDQLRFLAQNLYDAHVSNKCNLSDLYEIVQYSTSIIPRLYMMITVGSVLMRLIKEGPSEQPQEESTEESQQTPQQELPSIKDVLTDLLEMSRGVQHATRGLFLRYYLSIMIRDYLPDSVSETEEGSGTIQDSIQFILSNFIEMNKLWVRLQYQGTSKERERREKERKELRLLVGSNLVRLSQLETLSLSMYAESVLPSVLEEILSCKDVIAQEYLMEVIVQVFQDDFHLQTLDKFLSATAQLEPEVNVKQIVVGLLDRFSNYAARTKDESESRLASQEDLPEGEAPENGIPESIHLFEIFWKKIMDLVHSRSEFTIEDMLSLMVSMTGLSLNCYPDKLEYVDQIFGFSNERIQLTLEKSPEKLHSIVYKDICRQLLMQPLQNYHKNLLTLLQWPSSSVFNINGSQAGFLGGNFTDLLFKQSFQTRRKLAHSILRSMIRAKQTVGFTLDSVHAVNLIFGELCSAVVRDQLHDGLFGRKQRQAHSPIMSSNSVMDGNGTFSSTDAVHNYTMDRAHESDREEEPLEWEDIVDEQHLLCKLIHVLHHEDNDVHFQLLSTACKHLLDGGPVRIRFTLPAIVVACLGLAARYKNTDQDEVNEETTEKLKRLYVFVSNLIQVLSATGDSTNRDSGENSYGADAEERRGLKRGHMNGPFKGLMNPAEQALKLNLTAASSAAHCGLEEISYELFAQAMTLYEEQLAGTKYQTGALNLMLGHLKQSSFVFAFENMETLVTKCAVHASRLLKRADQARFLLSVAHLFHAEVNGAQAHPSGTYQDEKRVLDCLQKALKLADSVMSRDLNVALFVDILEEYLWFYQAKNRQISAKYIASLIELIQDKIDDPSSNPFAEESVDAGLLHSAGGTIVHHLGVHYEPLALDVPFKPELLSPKNFASMDVQVEEHGVSQAVKRHFLNVRLYIETKKQEEANNLDKTEFFWREI